MSTPSQEFRTRHRGLESVYLASEVPEAQSGYSGARQRWVAERSAIALPIDRSGSFLDVGCANRLLLEDLVTWAGEHGYLLELHGIDLGHNLVEAARARHPSHRANFTAADAWHWKPDRRCTFVYSLLDASPPAMMDAWIARLASWVGQGGLLILGSYGSTSRREPALDPAPYLRSAGHTVAGTASGAFRSTPAMPGPRSPRR